MLHLRAKPRCGLDRGVFYFLLCTLYFFGVPSMPKTHTRFVCQNCGRATPRYFGRCPACGEFNTMVEEVVETVKPSARAAAARAVLGPAQARPQRLADVDTDESPRLLVPIQEVNRVLGGGIVPGSIILIGGDPGIGKSTLIMQASAALANTVGRVLYVSGEESARQIKMRAERMGLDASELFLVTETALSDIIEHIRQVEPAVVVIDSIQTVHTEESESSPGSVSQVRECASRLQSLAKSSGVSVLLIGHVTKEGAIAGPRVLEHIVDTVLYLEGDPFQQYRVLRSTKNRFGATSEIGVFEMTGAGLREIANPSELFLSERDLGAPGTAVFAGMEGTRPLLVEIQALVSPSSLATPRRAVVGWDSNRLAMVLAVLEARCGVTVGANDVYLNVAGGLRIGEPAADLAVAAAVISSLADEQVPGDMVVFGEIGLGGEVRPVGQREARLREAAKLGFRSALIPQVRSGSGPAPRAPEGIAIDEIEHLSDLVARFQPADRPLKRGRREGFSEGAGGRRRDQDQD